MTASELHDLPPTIGELSLPIIETLPAEKYLQFAAVARESAEDYRRMASEHPALSAYYDKCAVSRDDDADWYERQAAEKSTISEAAE